MNPDEIQQVNSLIISALDQREQDNAYGVSKVSYHTHNGVDSPLITTGVGTGTVTSISIATANGFAGTVATATTTPVITLTTSITGILQGNGTAITGITIPSDATKFLDGTGAFSTPPSGDAYSVNADETSGIAFTTQINFVTISNTSNNGWTLTGAGANTVYSPVGSNGLSVANAGVGTLVANARMQILAPSSSNIDLLSADTPNTLRLRFYSRCRSATPDNTNRVAVGFSDLVSGSVFYSETATTGRDVKFVFDCSTVGGHTPTTYAVCSNAAAVTTVNLNIDPNTFHIYEIVVVPQTNAKFYIDGVLATTITTHLYASGAQVLNLEIGSYNNTNTTDITIYSEAPTFSITL